MTMPKEYYNQLVGATITGFNFLEDEYSLDPFPVFTMTLADKTERQVEVSRDEEGNGGGFLFISTKEDNG